MRHIIHTCMLALRLISSVDLANAKNKCLSIFDNAFLNDAFCWFYFDLGQDRKRLPAKIYRVTAADFIAAS